MAKSDSEIRNQILEMLFSEKRKGNTSLNLRDIAANIGVDYPTSAIPNADYLQGEGLIEYSSYGPLVSLTHEGERRVEAGFGIPSFYSEPITPKNDRDLRRFMDELNMRLATVDVGSRAYHLLSQKIDQAKFEIERREKKRLSRRERIYLFLAIIGAIVGISGVVFAALQYLNCQ